MAETMTKPPLPPIFRAALLAILAISPLAAETEVRTGAETVEVKWRISADAEGVAIFERDAAKPLVRSLGISKHGGEVRTLFRGLAPVTLLTVGSRDLANPAGWMRFFDNPPRRPHETFTMQLAACEPKVAREGGRVTVTVAAASAGPFRGDLRFTFYPGSGLILAEAVMRTAEDGRAILFDTGLTCAKPDWKAMEWRDPEGNPQSIAPDPAAPGGPIKVAGRTIAARAEGGSLAVFPAPHRYLQPQDEAYNLSFVWQGADYGKAGADYGFGIRQPLEGDHRYAPWFNAPPETEQHIGAFYYLSEADALAEVSKYTHGDRFVPLPGYKTFTSHYHVEHTMEYLRKQREQGTDGIPAGLEIPGFVKTFKARGVDIVHLAEFHSGETPGLPAERRLPQLKTLHEECARLSDEDLLVLPGEEPNVHLGGHWISLFPKPVYWVLNRKVGEPFVETLPNYGTVYHVGGPADVLELMEEENGLMWTTHARVKGSTGFPDLYKKADFYNSPHFLGAAWKAMPGDLSRPTLGWRALDLLDDMSNWGFRKQLLGECDLFRMEPDFESYAHMNINYVKLDKLPAFAGGWQPLLHSLRAGDFFTTTGEILITDFAVSPALTATLRWTFPMAFAEVVSGDGAQVFRQRIDLADTRNFGSRKLEISLDLKGRKWVRLEAWDVAGNGAFTQPVWLGAPAVADFPMEKYGPPLPETAFRDIVPAADKSPALWQWTIALPDGDWTSPDFDDADWHSGKSAFGTEGTPGTRGILNTKWNTRDLWIRRKVKLPASLGAKLRLRVHHDNSAEIYIDGTLAWKSVESETRGYRLFEIRPEAMAKLVPGATVTLAAHGHNVLGGQALDVGLVATE